MKLGKMKKVSALDLIVNRQKNFRIDYDLNSLREEVVSIGRITDPIHYRADNMMVLKGNRRALVAQEILADPKCPADLKKALEGIDCIPYTDVTPEEELEIMLDHGSAKPLSREETVLAIWRLVAAMKSERDIIQMMYNLLAKFTGNMRKAYEASQLPPGPARDKFLSSWLHGTVGNYIMAAGGMGSFVREQFLLNERSLDRALTEEEAKQVKFETSRKRIGELSSAKKADKEAGGWDVQNGGKTFNELLAKYQDEDSKPKKDRVKAFTSEQIETAADSCTSDVRLVYLKCANKLKDEDAGRLESFDAETTRRDKVLATIRQHIDRVSDAQMKQLLGNILFRTDKDVEAALQPFLAAVADEPKADEPKADEPKPE